MSTKRIPATGVVVRPMLLPITRFIVLTVVDSGAKPELAACWPPAKGISVALTR